MNNFEQMRAWIKAHADVVIDFMRIYLGVGLFLKGIYFMSHHDELARLMENLGSLWFVPLAVAHYIIPVHVLGGALLAFGLLTRIAALAQLPIIFGAVFYVYLPQIGSFQPRQSLEFLALVLFQLCLLVAYGSGRFSVDHLLWKKSIEPDAVPAAI